LLTSILQQSEYNSHANMILPFNYYANELYKPIH